MIRSLNPQPVLLLCLLVFGGCTPGSPAETSSETEGLHGADPSIREVAVPAGAESGRPRFSGEGGNLLLSWTEPTADSLNTLRYATWTGTGWSAPQTAATGRDWFVNWADTPGVVRRPVGGMLAHFLVTQANAENPYAYDIHLTTSKNGSWGNQTILNDDGTATEHGFVSAIPGLDGLVWLDGRGYESTNSMSLRFARIGADGALVDARLLDDRVCDCCPTDAVQTESGAVVVYRDRSPDEIRDIAIVRLVDGQWSEPTLVHADGWEIDGCPVNGPAVAAAGENVVVAWYTGAGNQPRVLVAFSHDAGATFGDPIQVDNGDPIGRVDVVFGGDGNAVVSWLERDDEASSLRIRSTRPEGVSAVTTIANLAAGRETGYPVISAVGDSLLVAWTDPDEPVSLRTAVVATPAFTSGE